MKTIKRYLALGMAVVLMGLSACGENLASISNGYNRISDSNYADNPSEDNQEYDDSSSRDKPGNESAPTEADTEPGRENAASESPAGSDPSKDELGWDGEWVGDGVSVIISDSDSGFPNVEFNDEAHNATLDEASIEGNTLTGVYRITWEMYADTDDVENLPEQEWTIVMVKDGGTASYHRETVLTWFNLNDDGTYGHTVTKENSASLQKVYKTEN